MTAEVRRLVQPSTSLDSLTQRRLLLIREYGQLMRRRQVVLDRLTAIGEMEVRLRPAKTKLIK